MQKYNYLFLLLICFYFTPSGAQEIKVEVPAKKTQTTFRMGTAVKPDGQSLLCDSKSLLLNGKPVIPVMGEIHYARCPEDTWETELLKMKAGGITIAASYIFWNHHEEEKGIFDWSASRNLRRFIEICAAIDLPVILRIGPFCHGEVRNGGIPDWVVNGPCELRSTDPEFIEHVRVWYANLYNQVKGLLWKEGGPVIGIQIDNEYGGEWVYLKELKKLAVETGFDVPLYTRTGWPRLQTPATFGEIIPLYGGYSDGFWDRDFTDMPGEYADAYLFRPARLSTVIATEQFSEQDLTEDSADMSYPYFTCELGGGMMSAYHRRIRIEPADIHTVALVKTGSGSNLPGYYMYHGGSNPRGIHHTLNEKQDSPYMNHNDLPAVTYDFQAPLGEFGRINQHYHWLRRLHLFLADFGAGLADMDAIFPENSVNDAHGADRLRWAVRSNGKSGYVFVNNYQRMRKLSDKKNIRFSLDLPDENIQFPEKPVVIPSGASFLFPFNLEIEGVTIKYATAQPFALIKEAGCETIFLAAVKDIPVEIMLDEKTTILSGNTYHRTKKGYLFRDLQPGKECVIDAQRNEGEIVRIIILDEETSLQSYKVNTKDEEYLFISPAVITHHKGNIGLEQWNNSPFNWSVYPKASFTQEVWPVKETTDGLFTRYELPYDSCGELHSGPSAIPQKQGTLRHIKTGARGVAEQPSDEEYKQAATWQIQEINNFTDTKNVYLKIPYEGDVARVYADGELIQDNFYNGTPMYVPMDKLTGKEVALNIFPLKADSLVYFQEEIRKKLTATPTLLKVGDIELVKRNYITVQLQK